MKSAGAPEPEQAGEVAPSDEQHRRRVALGLDALDVVAGIEPPTRDIAPRGAGHRLRVADRERRRVVRAAEHAGVRVVQVRRLPVEHRSDHVGSVSLGTVERARVLEQGCEQIGGVADVERWRRHGSGQVDDDLVGSGVGHAVEPQGVHVREPRAPRPQVLAHGCGEGDSSSVGHHVERRAAHAGPREQERPLPVRRLVAHLVHPHEGLGCRPRLGPAAGDRGARGACRHEGEERGCRAARIVKVLNDSHVGRG